MNITDRYDNSISYGSASFNETYKDKNGKKKRHINDGFIDPYYNYLTDDKSTKSKEALAAYRKAITTNIQSNSEAFLRNMLVHLRKMILDGLFISEIDIVAKNFDSISEILKGQQFVVSESASEISQNVNVAANKKILEEFGFNEKN